MELGPRVLVVDDDAGVRRMLARVLQQAGFACAQAESADAARGALAEQPVTALLCDVHLVGEDGLSLARWVRTHHRETAVLLITGSTSVEVDDIARHAVDGFLLKPFAAAEILINLRSAIARRTEALDRITSIERELRTTEHRLHETSDHLSETRAALVEREQLWKALVTSAPIGVALASGDGELTFSNDRFAELLDLSRCGDGARSRDWLAALDRRDVDRAVDAIRHPDSASAELRTRIDRGDRTLVMRCSVVDDRCPLSETMVITIEDVSDLVAAQRQFERQQLTDPITGLPNRSALVAHLATRLRTERSAPASVVTLNLNALRDLVLVAGEAAFDLAVGEVAARVALELVPGALLGRSGPTSLAIIVDTDDRLAVMSTVPARLARALTAPVTVGDDDLEVKPRIGIAVASRGSSGESLLRDSAIASEHAEAIGGVRVFNDAMRARRDTRSVSSRRCGAPSSRRASTCTSNRSSPRATVRSWDSRRCRGGSTPSPARSPPPSSSRSSITSGSSARGATPCCARRSHSSPPGRRSVPQRSGSPSTPLPGSWPIPRFLTPWCNCATRPGSPGTASALR